MSEFLLIVINFIVIIGIIKLSIGKYGKHKINKFAYSKDFGKKQNEYNDIVIGLNLMFLSLITYLELHPLIMMIATSIIAIVDIITVIRIGAFSRLKNSLNK